MKKFILSFIISCTCFGQISAMDQPTKVNPQPVQYSIPKEVDRDQLVRSSVIVQCGGDIGTGIAYGDRYVITGSHNIAGHVLNKCKIECSALKSHKKQYLAPMDKPNFTDQYGREICIPKFSECEDLQGLNIINVHIHSETRFEIDNASESQNLSLPMILEKYHETIIYGIKSAEKLSSYGVSSSFRKDGEAVIIKVRTFGPDVVILECDKPHGLPTIEISDPINEERSLVHIVGLTGRRYQNNDPSQIVGGVGCDVEMSPGNVVPMYIVGPKIYGQRFKCLPAYSSGLPKWINRPFMKILKGEEYLLESEVYPGAPEGFGLIAHGDSGAGGVVLKDGIPKLVGIASTGQIEPAFTSIHDLLKQLRQNSNMLGSFGKDDLATVQEMIQIYAESLKANTNDEIEKYKRWFITQTLTDLTHLKPWVQSVVSKSSHLENAIAS